MLKFNMNLKTKQLLNVYLENMKHYFIERNSVVRKKIMKYSYAGGCVVYKWDFFNSQLTRPTLLIL